MSECINHEEITKLKQLFPWQEASPTVAEINSRAYPGLAINLRAYPGKAENKDWWALIDRSWVWLQLQRYKRFSKLATARTALHLFLAKGSTVSDCTLQCSPHPQALSQSLLWHQCLALLELTDHRAPARASCTFYNWPTLEAAGDSGSTAETSHHLLVRMASIKPSELSPRPVVTQSLKQTSPHESHLKMFLYINVGIAKDAH